MVVHELATNLMKCGALGKPDGALAITNNVLPGNGCLFRWHETGNDTSRMTEKSGYGTMLSNTIIQSQLDGNATRDLREGR
jgi:two-component sensor histidine kinase